MKEISRAQRRILLAITLILLTLSFLSFLKNRDKSLFLEKNIFQTPAPSPSPSPSPKPLTFSQMNALYGPCVYLPVLYYHHIDSISEAKSKALTVDTQTFQKQMDYLQSKGYNTVTPKDLVNFFDSGAPISKKTIILTFDDGYEDFYTNAYPILQTRNFKGTVLLPTGLVGNPGFLTWDQIAQMNGSGLIYFANHTWSHHSVAVSRQVDEKEITTADIQLKEHGLNGDLVFGYPYGSIGDYAVKILESLNYKLAFTTVPGSVLCKKQRLTLPRVRIGNTPLSVYGF